MKRHPLSLIKHQTLVNSFLNKNINISSWIFPFSFIPEALLRSYLTNWCILFHQGFQTLENNKSAPSAASCFHLFSRVWKLGWNIRIRFWNSTWKIALRLLFVVLSGWKEISVYLSFFISLRNWFESWLVGQDTGYSGELVRIRLSSEINKFSAIWLFENVIVNRWYFVLMINNNQQ